MTVYMYSTHSLRGTPDRPEPFIARLAESADPNAPDSKGLAPLR
jgi:hypothetical protein